MSSLSEDLACIGSLPDENFQKAIATVSSENLDSVEWAMLVDKTPDEYKEGVKACLRMFGYIGETFAETRDFEKEASEVDDFMSKLAQSDEMARAGWERIKNSYEVLKGFFLKKKESDLKSRFSRVSSCSVTVDVRPLYSLDRSSIEKFLYPKILKIETSNDESFLCELYEESFDQLVNELNAAKKKLDVLKNEIENK